MGRMLTLLGALLAPWPGILAGVLALSLAQWLAAQASAAVLGQMLAADALMLLRALPLWCLLLLPTLALGARGRALVLGLAGTALLLALAALDLYFAVAGVPLGADLLAYSWQDMRTTVAGAKVSVPPALGLALVLGLVALWGSLWWLGRCAQPLPPRFAAGTLGLCLLGSLALPAGLAQAPVLAANKLQFLVGDVLAQQTAAAPVVASGVYPFERAETTPDTLGPLLALDPRTPPHLLVVVVEGLGRSFSGPGARLGSFTPFLDELAARSLYWENFLATQGRTFAVLPSVLGSLPFGPYGEQAIAHDDLLSLLKAQGYSLRYFSGTGLAFDHQGAFLASAGVDSFWSEKDFTPPAQKLSEWGYADGDLMDAVARSTQPKAPSITVVQTMSMHTPFVVPRQAHYRQQVLARLDALGVPQARREPYLRQQDVYASILHTDDALRSLFQNLSQRPEWKNTVVLITGDHRLPEIPMDTRIERYHVPLIVHSPMLREPRRIKALSSHFDIAPALLAMLSQRYAMPMPQRVHWMGSGLDVHPQWRNLHSLPLKQTKTELSDYVSGEYYLAQGQLLSLQDGLVTTPEDNAGVAQALRAEFAQIRGALARLAQDGRLVAESNRAQRAVYAEAGRTLQPAQRARQIEGVVVSQAQGRFEADGRLTAQGQFTQQGGQDSPLFVPLLVLTDASGRELGEVSGPAMRLQAGQSQAVSLALKPRDWPAGSYFVSLVVSHPETGKAIGKGQYHVEVRR